MRLEVLSMAIPPGAARTNGTPASIMRRAIITYGELSGSVHVLDLLRFIREIE